MNRGILAALAAYTSWGVLPAFWKLLADIPAPEILAHRLVWSLIVVILILIGRRHWHWLQEAVRNPRAMVTFFGTAALIGINWLTYIWAVNHNQIVETSLGYFINPLVSVLLGVLVLKERLRRTQWMPLGLVFLGVMYLTFTYGVFPWIGLTLAFTFGFYGLLRKTAHLQAMEGLALEMTVLASPALIYLLRLQISGAGSFGQTTPVMHLLLVLTGVFTAFPMIFFAYGAKRIRLSTLGVLQYIGPSLQFIFGVFVYHEPFSQTRLIGFLIIWAAIILYSVEGLFQVRKNRATLAAASRVQIK
ncbi:EamA family transporter RarD [bacterium]|nr:EamA family transporter RarD [bacterium]